MEENAAAEPPPGKVNGPLPGGPNRKRYTLDELVARITPDNLHEATDWGEPVGKEIW